MKNKEPLNCWEFKNCPKTKKNKCVVYKHKMGRKCWLVAGNFCSYPGEAYPNVKDRDLVFCTRECAWFKKINPLI